MKVVGGMANRQIARDLGVTPSTVDRQISRLGRHCLLYHRRMLEGVPPPDEIAIDGFETFELSQYYPTHFHLAIEPETSFLVHFTDSELRRKGRMTVRQKKRRRQLEARHGRPDPGAVLKDVTELLVTTLEGAERATVRSDLHKAYPKALRRLDCTIRHLTVSSHDPRDRNNILWEINRIDRMIRHSQAGHVRETLAWPKRRQRAAERLAVFLVWWNYMRKRWEKGRWESPGMLKRVASCMKTVPEILKGRIFATRQNLTGRWKAYYESSIETRALAINRRHDLRYAQ